MIDVKFVKAAEDLWSSTRVGTSVQIIGFKVMRIRQGFRYAAPGATFELVVDDANSMML